jgi:hypothetical protein
MNVPRSLATLVPLLAFSLTSGLGSIPEAAPAGPVRVFIMAGQSNMQGKGRVENGVGNVPGTVGSLRSLVDNDPAPSSGGTTGAYYTKMLTNVNDVLDNLGTYFPGYANQGWRLEGFAWHQGWNDRVNAA